MHRGVVGAVSEDDDFLDEPNGETGGDDGVGWIGQVICIYSYFPLNTVPKEESLKNIFDKSTKSRFMLSTIHIMGILNEIYNLIAINKPRQVEWPYSWLLKKSKQ